VLEEREQRDDREVHGQPGQSGCMAAASAGGQRVFTAKREKEMTLPHHADGDTVE
jgi:hypothetical protein